MIGNVDFTRYLGRTYGFTAAREVMVTSMAST